MSSRLAFTYFLLNLKSVNVLTLSKIFSHNFKLNLDKRETKTSCQGCRMCDRTPGNIVLPGSWSQGNGRLLTIIVFLSLVFNIYRAVTMCQIPAEVMPFYRREI